MSQPAPIAVDIRQVLAEVGELHVLLKLANAEIARLTQAYNELQAEVKVGETDDRTSENV